MDLKYFLLILTISLSCGEHHKHHSHIHHDPKTADGQNNEHFDHEAILGSKKVEDEFDGLSPEESKRRLKLLAKKMDTNNDDIITENELIDWIIVSFQKLDEEEAKNQIKQHDENNDGKITWREYMHRQYGHYPEDLEDPKTDIEDGIKKKIKNDEMTFKVADRDHDGVLSLKEYPGFEFPYEYSHMHDTALTRAMEDYDKNRDGSVSLEEFSANEPGSDPKAETEEKSRFDELDKNQDGKLEREEMKPWIVADNKESAKEEADHLITIADDNKNGMLDFNEIVNHYETFVGSQVTNYGDSLQKTEL